MVGHRLIYIWWVCIFCIPGSLSSPVLWKWMLNGRLYEYISTLSVHTSLTNFILLHILRKSCLTHWPKSWIRAGLRLAFGQRETSLQSNTVSHWLGANLELALCNIEASLSDHVATRGVTSSTVQALDARRYGDRLNFPIKMKAPCVPRAIKSERSDCCGNRRQYTWGQFH